MKTTETTQDQSSATKYVFPTAGGVCLGLRLGGFFDGIALLDWRFYGKRRIGHICGGQEKCWREAC